MIQNRYKPYWDTMRFEPLKDLDSIFTLGRFNDGNNVAFTSRFQQKGINNRFLEAEQFVIEWVKKLHLADCSKYTGEMVSGSSEGVLTALWHMRECQKQSGVVKTLVILSEQTHFSVYKACQILCLQYHVAKSQSNGTFAFEELNADIENEMSSCPGVGFIIVGTMGLTTTGCCDNFYNLQRIKRKLAGKAYCYIHIDAAIGGLCVRFLNSEVPLLDECDVDSFTIDFHKAGMCPYGTATLVLRNNLFFASAFSVPYHPSLKDYALLGSRSSIPALCAKKVINKFENNFKILYEYVLELRDFFVNQMVSTEVELLFVPIDIPMVTLSFDKVNERLKTCFIRETGIELFPLGNKIFCGRIFFNCQVNIDDVKTLVNKMKDCI